MTFSLRQVFWLPEEVSKPLFWHGFIFSETSRSFPKVGGCQVSQKSHREVGREVGTVNHPYRIGVPSSPFKRTPEGPGKVGAQSDARFTWVSRGSRPLAGCAAFADLSINRANCSQSGTICHTPGSTPRRPAQHGPLRSVAWADPRWPAACSTVSRRGLVFPTLTVS